MMPLPVQQQQRDECCSQPAAPSSPVPLYRHCDVLPTSLFQSLQSCQHQPNTEQQSYWIPLTHNTPTSPTSAPSSPTSPLLPSLPPATSALSTPLAHLSPSCPPPLLVEQAIHHLFRHVILPTLPATSSPVGLEWWLHTRPASSSMFLHFDRDEWRWQHKKEAAFPLLSSVTFLTNTGGPTFVVQQTTDSTMSRLYPDRTVRQCSDSQQQKAAALHGSLAWPMENTTITFPGNFLHGVLGVQHDDRSDLFMMKDEHKEAGNSSDTTANTAELSRVTLMINVWEEELQDPTCVTLREATSSYLQHRYGRVLSEGELQSTGPYVAPKRVELGVVSSAVMDELYRFDLQAYVNDELPICTDDDMAVCCASQLMCKSTLDSPPPSPVPSSPPPRPPPAVRPAFILVPHLGVHIVPADQPLPSAASICRLSPLDVQLRFSMTPDQLRTRAANLGCPLQSTYVTACGQRDVFGTAGSMLVQYDKHGVVDSIQLAHPAHVSLVSQLDHTPGCLLDDLLSLSVQSFYSSIKQLVDHCRCQLRPPQLTVLLTGEMAVSAWSFFARDELLGDETAVGHGVAVVGISNTQQRRTILPRPPVPKFGSAEKEKRSGGLLQAVKTSCKRKGETAVTADELIRQRTRVKDVSGGGSGGGSVAVQGKSESQLCPLRFLLAACEVGTKLFKRESGSDG